MNPASFSAHRRSHLLILLMIVLLAAGLRLFGLASLGFWTDELCSLSCADGWGLQFDQVPKNQLLTAALPRMTRLTDARPATAIIPAMARDEAHPPLYFLLLRWWEDLFGDSEFAVRSVDVVFSVAAVGLLFFTAKESVGADAALAACLVMAVATPQIQFSQEARNYMPVVTLSLVAALAIQRLKRLPAATPAVILGAAMLAMMLTHYFAAGVALALGGYALLALRGKARRYAVRSFTAAALAFLLLWGPFLLEQLPHFRSNYAWVSDTAPGHARRSFTTLLHLPLRLIGAWPGNALLRRAASYGGALFFAALPWAWIRQPRLRLWILWVICSIGLVLAVDLLRCTAQLALLRYTLFATPAVYVLIAGASPRGRFRFLLPLAAVLIALLSLRDAYSPGWKIDFRTPVQMVGGSLGPKDGLLIGGPDGIQDGVMFAAAQHYLHGLPDTCAVITTRSNSSVLSGFRSCPHVGVIWFWMDGQPPDFTIQERGRIQYFADLMRGRFSQIPTTSSSSNPLEQNLAEWNAPELTERRVLSTRHSLTAIARSSK